VLGIGVRRRKAEIPNETIFSDCSKLDRLLEGLVAAAMAEKGISHEKAVQEVAAQSPALCALRDALRMGRARLLPPHKCPASDAFISQPARSLAPSQEPQYYSGSDLCQMFGVSQQTLLSWIEKDLLGEVFVDFLVSTSQVKQFARKHPSEYSLRKASPRQMVELLFARPQERTRISLCPKEGARRKERP
jgi:hypothetical protein